MKDEFILGDYRRENEDEYVTNLILNKKRDLYLKIGMGALYITLLVLSLFIV